MKCHLKNFAVENKNQFNFNLLKALHLVKDAWNKVTELTVVNCFLKAILIYILIRNSKWKHIFCRKIT